MRINNITKEDTLIFKAIGILLIILHNFFHWMPPYTGENEWDFSIDRVNMLFIETTKYPTEFINLFFSYFGHYGVQIFIFISAVGLTLSMQRRNRSWGVFIIERLKKLYPLLFTGLVFMFFYEIIFAGKLFSFNLFKEFFYKLLFIHLFNVTPGSALSLMGPWWFFGLIFQLYVLFPFLYKFIKKYRLKAFISICIFSYTWMFLSFFVYKPETTILLLQNAPGHLPEFALGILLVHNYGKKINPIWFVLSLVVFVLGNFYKPFFPFTFLSITMLFYWFISNISKFIQNKTKFLKKTLYFYGSISMILFVIHGSLRPSFINISGETFYGRIFGAILFLIAATGLSILGNILYKWLVGKFSNITFQRKSNIQAKAIE